MTDRQNLLGPVTPAGERACAAVAELAPFLAGQAAGNDRDARFARESVNRLAEAGVLAACVPAEDGGYGVRSLRDLAAIAVLLGAADASVAVAVYMHLALTWYYARTVRHTPPAAHGKERAWLREIGARRMTVCSSVAEPGVQSWQLTTTAVPCAEGWRITGRKVLASLSPAATHFYSRVRAETADGPMQGSVMIPLAAPGVRVLDDWNGLGLRGSGSGRLLFTDVVVPQAAIALRGPWGRRDPLGLEGRAASSGPLLGVYLGIAQAARSAALAGLRTRGELPDGHSAGTKTLLAELEVRMTAASGALGSLLGTLDREVTDAAPRSLPVALGRELLRECVAAGIVVERSAHEVVDHAMQLCGGSSYASGHPLGRMYRDVRAASFMRPHTPAENWTDFLADSLLKGDPGATADDGHRTTGDGR